MAYETGASTGPDDLLDKLRLFLISTGWSVNKWDVDNSTYHTWTGLVGTGKRLHVQRAATDGTVMYFNFRSVNRGVIFSNHGGGGFAWEMIGSKYYYEITGIGVNGSTGYNGALPWEEQPGFPTNGAGALAVGGCITELSLSAIPAYYFFESRDTVVMVVEYETNKFQYIAFGCLEKCGTYTGGQFYSASLGNYDPTKQLLVDVTTVDRTVFLANVSHDLSGDRGGGAVYHDADGVSAWRFQGNAGSASSGGYVAYMKMPAIPPYATSLLTTYSICLGAFAYTRSPNELNGLATLMPTYIMTTRADGHYSFLGVLTGVRICNVEYYSPGQELAIADDTWLAFPAHTKEAECTNPHCGFAFHKTTGPSSSPSSTPSSSVSSSPSA